MAVEPRDTVAEPPYYYVRLAPFDKRLGHNVRKYGILGTIYRGGVRPTWYKVEPALAEILRPLRQAPNKPRSPALFQIYTEAERRQVDAQEERAALARYGLAAAIAPEPVTRPAATMDLTQGDRRGVLAGREAAVPTGALKPLSAEAPPEPPLSAEVPSVSSLPEGTGDLTSTELPDKQLEKKPRRRRGRRSAD